MSYIRPTGRFKSVLRYLALMQFFAALIIFALAALTSNPSPMVSAYSPGVLHFIGNLALFISGWLAFFNRIKGWKLIILLGIYSVGIELSQRLTQTRQVDIYDIVTNIAGLVCGLLLSLIMVFLYKRFSSRV